MKERGKETYLNHNYDVLRNNNEMVGEAISKVSRIDQKVYEMVKKLSKANKTRKVDDQFSAIREYFAIYLCESGNADRAPFLAVAPAPYLFEQPFKKYTLVIDILDCFCSRNRKSALTFRPFAEHFL